MKSSSRSLFKIICWTSIVQELKLISTDVIYTALFLMLESMLLLSPMDYLRIECKLQLSLKKTCLSQILFLNCQLLQEQQDISEFCLRLLTFLLLHLQQLSVFLLLQLIIY